MASPPVFGIVGYKNNGKTTLITRLVRHLSSRGLVVSTIKHAHHSVELDQPGKDSFEHRRAGAREVLLATSRRWFLVHELGEDGEEPPLEALLARMSPADLVLIEGFKRDGHPKLEVHRTARGTPLIAHQDPTVLAVASDGEIPDLALPRFHLDDIPAIADFVLQHARRWP